MIKNKSIIKKLFIKTLGCQMNEYDSLKILDVLKENFNIIKINNYENADIILINTCSIREKAQEKLFHELGRYKIIKKINTNLIIIVGGCVASQEGKNIFKRSNIVDIIFGPQTIHLLPQLILDQEKTKKQQINITFPKIEKFDYFPAHKTKKAKAFVSIMEGCDKYCSYCIVPYTRGPEVNRKFEDILGECAYLAEQGVKEITLLGQNVNHYISNNQSGDIIDLSMLIHFIAEIDNIKRIRFITSHPVEFSDNLINTYKTVPKLVNHLHLPVQHGSDKILKAMKRDHTILQYENKINKIKKLRPNISISSDFIIGFPGETEEDFKKLIQLIKKIQFDQSYSFIYSKRPGTPASNLLDNTPLEVKKNRLSILQNLLTNNSMSISRKMVGSIQTILVEGYYNKQLLFGKTENNRNVYFNGEKNLIGKLINVKIVKSFIHSLHATLEY